MPYRLFTSSSVLDFSVGFFGVYVVGFLISFLVIWITNLVPFSMQGTAILAPSILLFLFYIWVVWYVFGKGLKFVAWGLLTAVILPLLVFGACLGVMTNNDYRGF